MPFKAIMGPLIEKSSGLLAGMGGELPNLYEYNYPNSSEVENEISIVSAEAEKHPDIIYSHMLKLLHYLLKMR